MEVARLPAGGMLGGDVLSLHGPHMFYPWMPDDCLLEATNGAQSCSNS